MGCIGMDNFDISSYMAQVASKYGLNEADVRLVAEIARKYTTPLTRSMRVGEQGFDVIRRGLGPIITPHGIFYQMNFSVNDDWGLYEAIVHADIDQDTTLPIFDQSEEAYLRIDSGCVTGQLYLDQTCECKEQLSLALQELASAGQGAIVHIPQQDGRGRGLDFKLGTLYLQERLGVNTVESFTLLGGDPSPEALDCRTYDGAIAVLGFLGFPKNVLVATNNPKKLEALKNGSYVVNRTPIIVEANGHTQHHLDAKKSQLGHMF